MVVAEAEEEEQQQLRLPSERKRARPGEEEVEEAAGREAPAANLQWRHEWNTSANNIRLKHLEVEVIAARVTIVCTGRVVVSEGRQLREEAGGSRGGKARPQIGAVRQIISNTRQVGEVRGHVNLWHLTEVWHVEVRFRRLSEERGHGLRAACVTFDCT